MMTSDQYVHTMEIKAQRKQDAQIEAQRRRLEVDWKKQVRATEKLRREVEKVQRAIDARARAFRQN
jgi:hypothetical protein